MLKNNSLINMLSFYTWEVKWAAIQETSLRRRLIILLRKLYEKVLHFLFAKLLKNALFAHVKNSKWKNWLDEYTIER